MAKPVDSDAQPEDGKNHFTQPHGTVQIPFYNEVELASSQDLSIGAILRGTAVKPLNPFEKKAALINAELDKFGLGRYQICIWLLCGFGYFLDLAWAQGVGLIATAIYQEMNVADADTGTIFACANAGLAIGALGFGLAVDIIGRKWAFNLTCLITSIFGLLLVYSFGLNNIYCEGLLTRTLHRPLPSSIMVQSVESTSWRLSVLGATSLSMQPSLSSFFPKVAVTLSHSFPCFSPSALSLHRG